MKIKFFSIPFLSLIFFLSGCTGNAVYLKGDKTFAKTDHKNIKVYATIKPSTNYEVLGYVSTYSSGASRNEGDLLRDNLKKQAAKYGADAIIGFKLNIAITGGGGAEGVAVRFLP